MLYTRMMDTFNKLKTFVDNEIRAEKNLLIARSGGGFRVNRFTVHPDGDAWLLEDPESNSQDRFFSRKYAVLAAALLNKRLSREFIQLKQLDQKLAIASGDQQLYEKLLNTCRNHLNENVYIARLSRAKQTLEHIRAHIKQLEKSVQLQ